MRARFPDFDAHKIVDEMEKVYADWGMGINYHERDATHVANSAGSMHVFESAIPDLRCVQV